MRRRRQYPLPSCGQNRPIQSSALKPVSGVLRIEDDGRRVRRSPRCSITIGATSFDGSSTTSVPPHLSAVGIVTDVVLKPPEPAKTMPCDEPNEPSKQSSGDLPPAPQVSALSARNDWLADAVLVDAVALADDDAASIRKELCRPPSISSSRLRHAARAFLECGAARSARTPHCRRARREVQSRPTSAPPLPRSSLPDLHRRAPIELPANGRKLRQVARSHAARRSRSSHCCRRRHPNRRA